MPEIIDNVKVGEYIKKLLKTKNMTQDDLAEALSISKSAVSQNLRGKSSFDILNLVQIAKIFDITLDELLNLKGPDNSKDISEYQKVVNMGIDSFKNISSVDLIISEPDIYGKVLVDYIIEERKLDILLYLIKENVLLVKDYYHRASKVYLKLIKFLLEEDINEILPFIMKYTELNGSFNIEDETMSFIIWGLLNKPTNQPFVSELMSYKVSFNSRWFSKALKSEKIPLTKLDYIDHIAKYKLNHILDTFIVHNPNDESLFYVTNAFIKSEFYEGILTYINGVCNKRLGFYKKVSLDVQKSMLLVLNANQFELVVNFAEKELYTDMTQVIKTAILNKQERITSHLVAVYKDEINFKKIAEACVQVSNIDLLAQIIQYLTKDDLNYLLSWVSIDDFESTLFFIKHGAKIDEKYYNLETFKRVNKLIDHLINKGDNDR